MMKIRQADEIMCLKTVKKLPRYNGGVFYNHISYTPMMMMPTMVVAMQA